MSTKQQQPTNTGYATVVALLPRQDGRWKMHDGTLHFQSGYLDRVTLADGEVPFSQGPRGINLSLNILKERQYRDGKLVGSIEYVTWENGLLVASAVVAENAEIVP
jgi:hypothetical protein